MPMFEVETYKVSSELLRLPGETRPARALRMVGPVQYHGIQNRAIFAFSTQFNGIWPNPSAGYVTDLGYVGLSVAGWFPLGEFSYYYDILRSEKPVYVTYEYRESGSGSGYLRKVGLGTSVEPIGEGPSESTEQISSILAENLTAIRGGMAPMPVLKDLPEREE